MKKNKLKIILGAIVLLAGIGFSTGVVENPLGGGFQQTRNSASVHSANSVTVDEQLLATSSNRLYAEVVNGCSVAVYITASNDIGASTSTGIYLAASGGKWSTDTGADIIYTGSVRASSTNETACDLSVVEYK